MRRSHSLVLATTLAAALGGVGVSLFAYADPEPDAVLADGGRYYGSLSDGKLSGQGRLEWAHGGRYEGGFADGLFSGHGRLRYPTGLVYEGEFAQGVMSGRGKLVSDDTVYEGEFHRNQYWGQGELRYANGDVYTGRFERNVLHGEGHFVAADGETYGGHFADGEFTGKGEYSGPDGVHYAGEFDSWLFHGEGTYTDGGGNRYSGRFIDGQLTGDGRYEGADGTRYEGAFRDWAFHGGGTLTLPNGDVYEGDFRDGLYHGEGTLTYAAIRDGKMRESGEWAYGELQGEDGALQTSRNVEKALYAQPRLLDQALSDLLPENPAKVDLYLLAVAGDGSQEVFRREVEYVGSQFDRDFGTAGRSVLLVNSRNTATEMPMATSTSIRSTLQALAARMDKDEDILFLYLTSHGSPEHDLVLNQNGMDLPDLGAAELGRLLRESGIRHKVVVISACFSGGFIDEIKDPSTLVITAASADRASFGCSDENDFTYFGRAFFKEALPESATLEAAFARASELVAQWEAEGGLQHSLPQLHASEDIRAQLARWRSQLNAPQTPLPGPAPATDAP